MSRRAGGDDARVAGPSSAGGGTRAEGLTCPGGSTDAGGATGPDRSRPTGDGGSVLVLVLGLAALLLVLVGVVVDVSVAVLAKRSVASAADGAAVAAAQELDYSVFYAQGPSAGVPLSAYGVADRVAAYEAQAARDQPGLQLAGGVDGAYTAVVDARRTVALPFSGRLGRSSVEVRAQARARAPLAPAGPG